MDVETHLAADHADKLREIFDLSPDLLCLVP